MVDSFVPSPSQPNDKSLRLQAGQIVVEYVMMLLVAITIALLVIQLIVSRTPGDEGFLIKAWDGIIRTISSDKTDEVEPQNPGNAGP